MFIWSQLWGARGRR